MFIVELVSGGHMRRRPASVTGYWRTANLASVTVYWGQSQVTGVLPQLQERERKGTTNLSVGEGHEERHNEERQEGAAHRAGDGDGRLKDPAQSRRQEGRAHRQHPVPQRCNTGTACI